MCSVPDDFLELATNGMVHLHKCNLSNVMYLMCQALGAMKPDQSDTLLPAKRMLMGLIEHIVDIFFYCQTSQRGKHVPLILPIVLMFVID